MTWPTTFSRGSAPQTCESKLRLRLSPRTKRLPGGTRRGSSVYAGAVAAAAPAALADVDDAVADLDDVAGARDDAYEDVAPPLLGAVARRRAPRRAVELRLALGVERAPGRPEEDDLAGRGQARERRHLLDGDLVAR